MPSTVPHLRLLSAICLGSLAAALLPVENITTLRVALHDLLVPGQILTHNLSRRATAILDRTIDHTHDDGTNALAERLAAAELRNRRLELEAAALRQQIQTVSARDAESFSIERPASLFKTALLEARVLGEDAAALWRHRATIGAGGIAGVAESSLVLNDEQPLLDQGTDSQLHAGDAIYAGRTVIGKVAEVGRWSSTVRRVTDPGFSGRARLARHTARGLVFLSEGTLIGDGSNVCRLRHIAEPVNVGDEVFTGGTDGILPYPMYYGSVVFAELEPAAGEWTVHVKSAAPEQLPHVVHILRIEPNPVRLLAN